jgi:hypothetical protein
VIEFRNRIGLMRSLVEMAPRLTAQIQRARCAIQASHTGLQPGQRLTLEIGCWVVLTALGVGLQLGQWSAWTALVALGGYLAWVVLYSEATVQARRRARPQG